MDRAVSVVAVVRCRGGRQGSAVDPLLLVQGCRCTSSAEGESATRATASEMGGPTFRHYKHRQLAFAAMLVDLAAGVLVNAGVSVPADFACVLPDLTRDDNLQLAQAMREVGEALAVYEERGWMTGKEAAAVAKRMSGEV